MDEQQKHKAEAVTALAKDLGAQGAVALLLREGGVEVVGAIDCEISQATIAGVCREMAERLEERPQEIPSGPVTLEATPDQILKRLGKMTGSACVVAVLVKQSGEVCLRTSRQKWVNEATVKKLLQILKKAMETAYNNKGGGLTFTE